MKVDKVRQKKLHKKHLLYMYDAAGPLTRRIILDALLERMTQKQLDEVRREVEKDREG